MESTVVGSTVGQEKTLAQIAQEEEAAKNALQVGKVEEKQNGSEALPKEVVSVVSNPVALLPATRPIAEIEAAIANAQASIVAAQKKMIEAATIETAQAFIDAQNALKVVQEELKTSKVASLRTDITSAMKTAIAEVEAKFGVKFSQVLYSVTAKDDVTTTKVLVDTEFFWGYPQPVATKQKKQSTGTSSSAPRTAKQWKNTETGVVEKAKVVYYREFAGLIDGTAKAGNWAPVLKALQNRTEGIPVEKQILAKKLIQVN